MQATVLWMAIMVTVLIATPGSAAILHVKPPPAGNDANSGVGWANAKATVTGALAVANTGDEVWVAAGTYPEHIKNRTTGDGASIDIKLYGGFKGDETTLGQRNWQNYITILDGGGGEPPMPPASGSVVTITGGASPDMRVDGFTITGGHAYLGGGISLLGSAPTIVNNHITDNMAGAGAGIFCTNYKITPPTAQPAITDNIIDYNYASDGGGIGIEGTDAIVHLPSVAPLIASNLIIGNVADFHAGGIGTWGHASPIITNNVIRSNGANYDESSGNLGGGGIYATADDLSGEPVQYAISAPTIVNNLIAANGANQGAGICLIDYRRAPDPGLTPPPKLINNTIVANNGAGIYWDNNFPVISNNLIAFNAWGVQQGILGTSYPAIGNNCVYGNELQGQRTDYQDIADQTGTSGNISANPLLANTTIGNYHLQPGSPCINAGSAAYIDQTWLDLDGQARVIGGSVDIGADEADGTSWNVATPVYRVSPAGNDGDGLSWATAKKTLQGGLNLAAVTGGEVWVAAASYAEHIRIPAYVYLYGGFAGNETSRTGRNVIAHPAIIDGGGVPSVVYSANSGYLVSALDGFTVQNGGVFTGGDYTPFLNQPNSGYGGRGAGVVSRVSSLYLENCTIRRNSLGNPFDNANKLAYGGGLFGYLSYAIVKGNTFADNELLNTFDGSGGGMYLTRSRPIIDGNTFTGNQARNGAAIYGTLSNPVISRNTFSNNSFYTTYPLPLYFGALQGAVNLDLGPGFLIEGNLFSGNRAATGAAMAITMNMSGSIRNNLITGNTAVTPETGYNNGMGGGIYCSVSPTAAEDITIVNNTIVGNSAGVMPGIGALGGGIAISLPPPLPPPATTPPGKLIIGNNIIAFNSSGIFQTPTTPMLVPQLVTNDLFNTTANYVNITPGASDISADPSFVNRPTADYRLAPGSPCIDTGSNSLVPAAGAGDRAGNPRIVDGNHDGVPTVDMGAYEHMTSNTLTVTVSGTGQGAVTITPPGAVTNTTYSGNYTSDTLVTLHGAALEYSLFDGWSGMGCSGTVDCMLLMATDATVDAHFTKDTVHAVLLNGVNYPSLQAAYDIAGAGSLIKAWAVGFKEKLNFAQAKKVTIAGGYNAGYTDINGYTVVQGSMFIRRGAVAVKNLIIR
jgi:hypothetical protein